MSARHRHRHLHTHATVTFIRSAQAQTQMFSAIYVLRARSSRRYIGHMLVLQLSGVVRTCELDESIGIVPLSIGLRMCERCPHVPTCLRKSTSKYSLNQFLRGCCTQYLGSWHMYRCSRGVRTRTLLEPPSTQSLSQTNSRTCRSID
jgi:hypothetical protein